MGEFVTIAAHREGSGRSNGERRYTTASGRTLWIHNDDVMSEEGHASYTEPVVMEPVSVFAVTYKDGSELVFPAPQGIMYSEGARTVRVFGGPTVSLVEARFWQVEKR